MATQTADYNVNDGTGALNGTITYDDAQGNQVTRVDYNNGTTTDWVLTIESGAMPPLKTTIRKGRVGSVTNAGVLAGYVGDPLLIEIGST
jgi:hypothetical protein